jgi:molybdenum cofactor cytidylyltransferase
MRKMSNIAGILLAAGESTRMGEPKPLLPHGESTFIDTILNNLAAVKCEPIISILGSAADLICTQTSVNAYQCFNNPHPEFGQLSSLKIAIEHLPPETTGFLLTLVDHPLVKPETYEEMMRYAEKYSDKIIIPEFFGRRGHPVYFGQPFFKLILDLPLDQGANVIVRENQENIQIFPVNDAGILKDIDTPEDFKREVH